MAFVLNRAYEKAMWVLKEESFIYKGKVRERGDSVRKA